MTILNFQEAADHLKVSQGTIKNWVRQGLIMPQKDLSFYKKDIINLKKRITSTKSTRLSSRANKSIAKGKFIPLEYLEKRHSQKDLKELAEQFNQINKNISLVLFALSIIVIYKSGLIKDKPEKFEGLPYISHKEISLEVNKWYLSLHKPILKDLFIKLSKIKIPDQNDTLGLVYQILQTEGRKSKKGSYYTPKHLADEVFTLYGSANQSFLDPCCGSGAFLLAAAKSYSSPFHIYGWDSDELAVRLSRLNLMLYFKEIQFKPNIYQKDYLKEPADKRFDLIASNPPWGLKFSKIDHLYLQKHYGAIKTGESFSYFILSSLKHITEKGVISFILPESLLKVKTHLDIRQEILNHLNIKYLKYLGKPFNKVQTEVIRMDLSKKYVRNESIILRQDKIYSIDRENFYKNRHFLFNFNCSKRDHEIIKKVYSRKNMTLKNNTLWILGVVSGDNKRFITQVQNFNSRSIICGLDVDQFKIKESGKYIYFNQKILQQSAPLEFYNKSPKIIYRFISDKLIFAIDRKGLVTLNSANSFYPQGVIPVELIVAFFNSSLYQFIYKKSFNSIKILKCHLEQLPLPIMLIEEQNYFIQIVKRLELCKEEEYTNLKTLIDEKVFQFFKISAYDKAYILENL